MIHLTRRRKSSIPRSSRRVVWKSLLQMLVLYLGIPLLSAAAALSVLVYVLLSISHVTVLETFLHVLPQPNLKGINILAFGIDGTTRVQRSDTIMLIHLDPARQEIGVLSIPRDTKVKVEGVGMTRINHSYAYGGTSLLRQTVADFLDLPIDHVLKIDLSGVSEMVDVLGGVEVTVDKDLYYVDRAGGLYIDLKKGRQRLSGDQALQYLRFRRDNQGDIGRISRQQLFLREMLNQVLNSGRLFEIPALLSSLNRHVHTDMSLQKMIAIAVQFSKAMESGRIRASSVPGSITLENGVSYWKANISELDNVVDDIFFGSDDDRDHVDIVEVNDDSNDERRQVNADEIRRVASVTNIAEANLTVFNEPLIVEVLNGYGRPGEAQVAARFLKDQGAKVFRYGNSGSFSYEETVLVSWKNDIERIVLLASILYIDPSKIIVYDRPDKQIDATVVLGKDWESIKKKQVLNVE